MRTPIRIIYGHDPLCGWCYGFIPAMRLLKERFPDAEIELVGGGLFSGDNTPQYQDMTQYIPAAFERIEARSGQRPGEKFYDLLNNAGERKLASAAPTLALQHIEALAPEAKLEFAHRLQEAYFKGGHALDEAATYDSVTDAMGLPRLDTEAILAASDQTPDVAQSYERARALDISSFPTIIVVDDKGEELGRVASEYNPEAFVADVARIAHQTEAA